MEINGLIFAMTKVTSIPGFPKYIHWKNGFWSSHIFCILIFKDFQRSNFLGFCSQLCCFLKQFTFYAFGSFEMICSSKKYRYISFINNYIRIRNGALNHCWISWYIDLHVCCFFSCFTRYSKFIVKRACRLLPNKCVMNRKLSNDRSW